MKLKVWFLETRPQFLLLSMVLAFLGTCIAWYDGVFHLGHAVLAFVGLLLAHISVNVLNDYFDYRSGIDLETKRTPFSGGSGILPGELLKPKQVLWLGLGSLILAIPIGIYFVIVKGWLLLPLLLVAAACVLLYTPFILKSKDILSKRDFAKFLVGVTTLLGTPPFSGDLLISSEYIKDLVEELTVEKRLIIEMPKDLFQEYATIMSEEIFDV